MRAALLEAPNTDLKVVDFRGFRKIGVMEKTDSG